MRKWAVTAGCIALATACSAAAGNGGYSFGVVEFPMPGATSAQGGSNPLHTFQALWATARERAARETLDSSSVRQAIVGGTPFRQTGDRMLVRAITPERGVFYILPKGPYAPSGAGLVPLPNPVQACRIVIDWASTRNGPVVPGFDCVDFPDDNCRAVANDFEQRMAGWEASSGTRYVSSDSVMGKGLRISLLRPVSKPGFDSPPFNPVHGVEALLGPGEILTWLIPISGLVSGDIAVARTNKRANLVIVEDLLQSRNMRCIVEGLGWDDLADRNGGRVINAQRICTELVRKQV